MNQSNLIGALTAIVFFLSAILVFVFRLLGKPQYGRWIGVFEFFLAIPLIYLLLKAPSENRQAIYYIQIGAILLWMAAELLLDYIYKIEFRQIKWVVIGYVMLFFAGTGGLLGISMNAGPVLKYVSICLFFIMAVLTFVQRKVTGM